MATFHLFPRLPAELRLQIWEMTVEPRVVEVLYRGSQMDDCATEWTLCSSTPIPAPLQTYRESRNAGLYQRFLSSQNDRKDERQKVPRYVWVNLDIDIIFVNVASFHFFKTDGHLIKRLRFLGDWNEWWYILGGNNGLRNFPNVTEIHVILIGKDEFKYWHGASLNYWPCGEENILFIDPKDGTEMTLRELESKLGRPWERG